jgi:NCS2 family nucleobase:cation symporter-2
MNQKPANIIYGLDDVPPFSALFFLVLQHAVLALVFIVYPLMLVAEVHGTQFDAEGSTLLFGIPCKLCFAVLLRYYCL